MQYAAVKLGPSGAVIRHAKTQEVANVFLGDFDSLDHASAQACVVLKCTCYKSGLLRKVEGGGGFLLVTTQELDEI